MADAIAQSQMYEEKVTARFILGGALAETITGAGIVVLAIIGLAGFLPTLMLAVATIGLGAVASRLSALVSEVTGNRIDIAELGGGLTAEFTAGLAGIALGVLALVGVHPAILTAVAAVVFGGALIMGTGVKAKLSHLTIGQEQHKLAREIAREALMASTGVQTLVGLGAVVLGILALLNIHAMELSLVAVLSVAGMLLLGGTALGARMMSLFRH